MAIQWTRSASPATDSCLAAVRRPVTVRPPQTVLYFWTEAKKGSLLKLRASTLDRGGQSGGDDGVSRSESNYISNNRKGRLSPLASVPNSNYVVPMDKSSCTTRPLGEILRDLNKRIPDNIIKLTANQAQDTFMPWYHANRMLSFYAPGWCGEVRDVTFSDNGSVTVVYRVTIRGSDGEAHRESTGTVSSGSGHGVDPVAAAEEIAFCRACTRFGLGLYLYHDE